MEGEGKGCFIVDVNVEDTAAGGGEILSILNPESADVLITRAILYTEEAGAGETDINMGVGGDDDGDYSNIFSNNRADQAGNIMDSLSADGEVESIIWEDGDYLTITKEGGAGDSEIGIAGRLYLEYIRL